MPAADRLPVDVIVPAWGHYLAGVPAALASAPLAARHIVVTDAGVHVDPVAGVPLTVVTRPGPSLAEARNAGLQAATSRYVMFFDADDQLLPGALEVLTEAAATHPRATVVFGLFQRPDGSTWPPRWAAQRMAGPLALPLLLSRNTLPAISALVLRSAAPPDLFPPVRIEDWPAAVRLRARGPAVFCAVPVMAYTVVPGSRSRSAISADEVAASFAELLPALLRERTEATRWVWRLVDRVAGRRRARTAAALSAWDDTAATPSS